jgi:glycosyltransferase involved in cell wall biosynthesis
LDVVFVWIGGSVVDNYYGKEVQKWLEDNSHLKEKVYFLPFRKDAVQLMADFDILLLTSDSEGMPLVVLEAQSLGVPVVSTDVGCVGEMIGDQQVAKGLDDLSLILLNALRFEKNTWSAFKKDYQIFLSAYRALYTRT